MFNSINIFDLLLTKLNFTTMKKLFLVLSVTTVLALSSCSKCDKCSGADNAELNRDYCDDDFSESQLEAAEAICISDNGIWVSK